jgi:hypothetical protein
MQGEPLSLLKKVSPVISVLIMRMAYNYVGIIMENNYIIHASGKVRIDRIDIGIIIRDNKTHAQTA